MPYWTSFQFLECYGNIIKWRVSSRDIIPVVENTPASPPPNTAWVGQPTPPGEMRLGCTYREGSIKNDEYERRRSRHVQRAVFRINFVFDAAHGKRGGRVGGSVAPPYAYEPGTRICEKSARKGGRLLARGEDLYRIYLIAYKCLYIFYIAVQHTFFLYAFGATVSAIPKATPQWKLKPSTFASSKTVHGNKIAPCWTGDNGSGSSRISGSSSSSGSINGRCLKYS